MLDILNLDREGILSMDPNDIDRRLKADEVIHMATRLEAYWTYNYEAAKAGKLGFHAILKSGLHSNGFFMSSHLLEPENVRTIMAKQIVRRLQAAEIRAPTHMAGVPNGATELAKAVSRELGTQYVELKKEEGKIVLKDKVPPGARLLLGDDACTRGTGFREGVEEILLSPLFQKGAELVQVYPVILNRGGLEDVQAAGRWYFPVLPIVVRRLQDWDPTHFCDLCAKGSKAIKPKVDDATWQRFIHSQD